MALQGDKGYSSTRLHAGINIYLRSLKKVVEFSHPHPRLILVPLVSKYIQLNIKLGGWRLHGYICNLLRTCSGAVLCLYQFRKNFKLNLKIFIFIAFIFYESLNMQSIQIDRHINASKQMSIDISVEYHCT